MEDQQGDTLIYSDKIKLRISKYSRSKKLLIIKKIDLDNADIFFSSDSAKVLNLKFLINSFKNPDKAKDEKIKLNIQSINLHNSRFRYHKIPKKIHKYGIDFNKLELNNINLKLHDFTINGDTANFNIKSLNFNEKTGLSIKNIKTHMAISRKHMFFENTFIKTDLSEISLSNLAFNFNHFKEFRNFTEKVNLQAKFRSSSINTRDISFFSPVLTKINETFLLSGVVSGTINDLFGEDILLSAKEKTYLRANFNIIGLPDINETFMHYDILSFQTHLHDIKTLNLTDRKIIIPEGLDKIGTIDYSGKFTGYTDDFVAYGILQTDLGKVSTDILFTPSQEGGLSFEGKVNTQSLAIGELLKENDFLGDLSMKASVDGSIKDKKVAANLTGIVDSIEFYHYNYNNIKLSGYLSDKTFDGSFDISDPNIQMEFLGKVDFSDSIPVFDFTADVARLRPYYLNISKSDPNYFTSFFLTSNFSGIDPDNINGQIKLVNSFFKHGDEQLQIFDFSLKTKNSPDSSEIQIRSDIFDADIKGRYKLSEISRSFKKLASQYIPSIKNESSLYTEPISRDSFDYIFNLKNINEVVHFFTKDYEIGNNASISGSVNTKDYKSIFTGNFPLVAMKNKKWENINIIAETDSVFSKLTAVSTRFQLNESLSIENLIINSSLTNDSLTSQLSWKKSDSLLYEGNINILANFAKNIQTQNLTTKINILPSYLFYRDNLWDLPSSRVFIDSNSFQIDTFQILNQDQKFLITGSVSEKKKDKLSIKVENFQISSLNNFIKSTGYQLAGLTTGEASLSAPENQTLFLSDLNIKEFSINNESLGNGKIQAAWNNNDKRIHVFANSQKTTSEIFRIEGDYFPKTRNIDFLINYNKLKLSILSPLASKLVSNLKGLGNGHLILKGSLEKPELNGEIDFFKTSFTVDYLQTRYSINDKVSITNNNISFNDLLIRDEYGNTGILTGKITSNYLKKYILDLKFESDKFLFLNTNEFDNQSFYGKIFAGGIINFSGPTDKLFMQITARTERNSVFYIPLFGTDEVNESDFIQFANTNIGENQKSKKPENYEVNMDGLSMDFKLEVTPDAEVQLIFDPKVGDILRGRGNGSLNMSINTLRKFEIYGDMIIEEGDYLFTLQNVINKRFKVKQGGSISWNGDPADASIDLQAIYSMRTSVYELSPDAQEELKKRIPVECHILMADKLMNPTIKTDIVLPTADQETKNIVANSINTEEELTKQFLSLLVLNNFYSESANGAPTGYSAANVAGVAASELFSNQLSNWISQISNDFDFGINYRPGDDISSEEVELALSTQILNDRLSINGNLDVGGKQSSQTTNTNNIVGDFDLDFKLTNNGKLHLKAFNRANDNLLFEASPYTQGVGVFYREDFDSFSELMKRYKDAIGSLFRSKKKKNSNNSEKK